MRFDDRYHVRFEAPATLGEDFSRMNQRLSDSRRRFSVAVYGGETEKTVTAHVSRARRWQIMSPRFVGVLCARNGGAVLEGTIFCDLSALRRQLIGLAIAVLAPTVFAVIVFLGQVLYAPAVTAVGVWKIGVLTVLLGIAYLGALRSSPIHLKADTEDLIAFFQAASGATDVVVEKQTGAKNQSKPGWLNHECSKLGLESLRLPVDTTFTSLRALAILGLLASLGFFIFYPIFKIVFDRGFTTVGALIPFGIRGGVPLIHLLMCSVSLYLMRELQNPQTAGAKAAAEADLNVAAIFAVLCAWAAVLIIGTALTGMALFY